MAWPYTNLTTYVSSSTPSIKALDLNDIQTALTNIQSGLAPAIYQAQGATDSPILTFADSAANSRAFHDHTGYQFDRNVMLRENWLASYSVSASTTNTTFMPWQVTNTANFSTAASLQTSSGQFTGPAVQLISGTTANTNNSYIRTQNFAFTPSNSFHRDLTLAWEANCTALSSNPIGFFVGLSSAFPPYSTGSTIPDAHNSFIGFYCDLNTASEWIGVTANGTSSSTTSASTAFTTGTWARFRLEHHGSSTPYGTKARFFYNDTLLGELTTNLPTSGTLYLGICAYTSGNASGSNLLVGPMTLTYNRLDIASPVGI